jgi:deoxyhypusine synthase
MVIDMNADLTNICDIAVNSKGPIAAIVLGGGMVKYHVMNACKMGGGLDYGVFITVADEWDGSYSGATMEEEIGRRAIKPNAKIVTLKSEFSVTFPVIVANTFAKYQAETSKH